MSDALRLFPPTPNVSVPMTISLADTKLKNLQFTLDTDCSFNCILPEDAKALGMRFTKEHIGYTQVADGRRVNTPIGFVQAVGNAGGKTIAGVLMVQVQGARLLGRSGMRSLGIGVPGHGKEQNQFFKLYLESQKSMEFSYDEVMEFLASSSKPTSEPSSKPSVTNHVDFLHFGIGEEDPHVTYEPIGIDLGRS